MNKRISGFGMIKSGLYENILVEGSGVAFGDVDVDHIKVQGTFKGKGVRKALDICVEGVAKIKVTDFANELVIMGNAKIKRTDEDSVTFWGEGAIDSDTFECKSFHLTGSCHIHKLTADEIHILEDKNNRNAKARQSVIEQICCKKLVAYHLKAKTIDAQEVQLHGNCKIDTLICDRVDLCDPECIIENHVSR